MNSNVDTTTFELGSRLVKPFLHLDGQVPLPSSDPQLQTGIRLLKSCATDDFWEAHWFLGKAYEAICDYERSADHFALAFAAAGRRTEVIHEFIIALLRVQAVEKARGVIDGLSSLDDAAIRFDAALVRYASGESGAAATLLDEFTWPERFKERVSALRATLRAAI